MNYHYIEYMLKEQKKEEIAACQRMRTLKGAGYPRGGLMERVWSAITHKARLFRPQIESRVIHCRNCLLQRKLVTQIKGKSL